MYCLRVHWVAAPKSYLFRAPTHDPIQQAQSLGAVRIASFELKPTDASDCTFHDMPANQTAVDKVSARPVCHCLSELSLVPIYSHPPLTPVRCATTNRPRLPDCMSRIPRSLCGRARPPCLCGKCRAHRACRLASRVLYAWNSCSREAKAEAPPQGSPTICIST